MVVLTGDSDALPRFGCSVGVPFRGENKGWYISNVDGSFDVLVKPLELITAFDFGFVNLDNGVKSIYLSPRLCVLTVRLLREGVRASLLSGLLRSLHNHAIQ